jgi:uncharacterized protein (DUF736 family)
MPNATGYENKQDGGRYKGTLRTVSVKADIDIFPNMRKVADRHIDFRMMTEGIEIGTGWTYKSDSLNKEYVRLLIVALESGPKKL